MKIIKYYILIFIFLFGYSTHTIGKEPFHNIISCKMSNGNKITLKVLHITNNKKYFLNGDKPFIEINGKLQLAFANSIRDDFVGDIYLAQCNKHTLIFAMGQVSAYLSGIAIRENSITHQYESIYFAEKALPHWLYFKNNEWGIIIPNIGNETRKKYLVYTYKSGKTQPERQDNMTPMDNLPAPRKNLAHIRLPKNLG